jgi:hypothetical protein
MTDMQLSAKINSLPKELQTEVFDFIEFLMQKSKPEKKKKERVFGYAKGFFKLKADFESPIDDFKEYQ